jgi:CheY-like chemotaxis protein
VRDGAKRRHADDSPTAEARVLFVSPAGVDRDLYVSALREAGLTTTVADTSVAAARWLEEIAVFNVVVVDLLPESEDAWALIARICAHSSRIPVMVFTSLIRPDGLNRRRARALGCAAFVAKPCSLRQLVDIVRRVQSGERNLEVVTYAEPQL